MKLTLLLFFSLIFQNSFSQVNYDDLKGQYVTYCGIGDSTTVLKNVAFVDSVSLLKIDNGLEDFLMNYGQAYHAKYLFTNEKIDLIMCISAHTRCWEQFKNTRAL